MIRLLVTALLSIGIAMGLSWIPKLAPGAADLPAFGAGQPRQLSDGNVVDLLSELMLSSQIRNVDWSQSILSVDLKLRPGETASGIYRDMYQIAHTALAGTTNVRQVLIRVLDEGAAGGSAAPQLVIALSADRSGLPRGEKLKDTPDASGEYGSYLSEHFRLTYTVRWKEMFGTSA